MHFVVSLLTVLLKFVRIYHGLRLIFIVGIPVLFFIIWLITALIVSIRKKDFGTLGQRLTFLILSEASNIIIVLLTMLAFYFAGKSVLHPEGYVSIMAVLLKTFFYIFGLSCAVVPLCSIPNKKRIIILTCIGGFLLFCVVVLGIIVTSECMLEENVLLREIVNL